MRINKKSEGELLAEQAKFQCLPEGEYEFAVESAQDTTSAKGNEMIKLVLVVYTDDRERKVWDYLLDAMGFKLRHFCAATGLIDKYEQSDLKAADCEGVRGRVKLGVEPAQGQYKAKNTVEDYMPLTIPKDRQRPNVINKPRPVTAITEDRPPLTDEDCPF